MAASSRTGVGGRVIDGLSGCVRLGVFADGAAEDLALLWRVQCIANADRVHEARNQR